MATEVLSGRIGEFRAASTADGGTALTTTATFIQLPKKSEHLLITPRNFATAVVAKIALNPWLIVLKSTDAGVTFTDYSSAAQDADAATDVVLSSLDTVANGDFLLVGSHVPFRGAYLDVDGANSAAASSLTVSYWKDASPDAWATTSATDGTSDATRPFAQDGLVYWTVPTDWIPAKLSTIYSSYTTNLGSILNENTTYYWTRWSVDVACDSATTLNSLVAANRSTAYAELLSGQVFEERIKVGLHGVGCIEALTNAGTANLVVNVATAQDGRFA